MHQAKIYPNSTTPVMFMFYKRTSERCFVKQADAWNLFEE